MPKKPSCERPSRQPVGTGKLTAYIDGGSRGNPGEAGFGVHLLDSQERTVARISGYLGKQTNNYAEYSALLAALRFALNNGFFRLKVFSDSLLVVQQVLGRYKVKHQNIKPLHEQAHRYVGALRDFSIEHIPREQNKEADRLANQAMDSRKSRVEVSEPSRDA